MYKSDYGQLIIFMFMIIFVIVISIYKRKRFTSYKMAFYVLFAGISWLIISCIFNNLAANRWDKEFIVEFLLLKKGGWLFRQFVLLGYVHFIWSVIVLFLTKRNRSGR